jgi:hypothetical protein
MQGNNNKIATARRIEKTLENIEKAHGEPFTLKIAQPSRLPVAGGTPALR